MASKTITIPNNHAIRIAEAYAVKFGYEQNKNDGETKGEFAWRMMAKQVRNVVKEMEQESVVRAAAQNAQAALDAEIETIDITVS